MLFLNHPGGLPVSKHLTWRLTCRGVDPGVVYKGSAFLKQTRLSWLWRISEEHLWRQTVCISCESPNWQQPCCPPSLGPCHHVSTMLTGICQTGLIFYSQCGLCLLKTPSQHLTMPDNLCIYYICYNYTTFVVCWLYFNSVALWGLRFLLSDIYDCGVYVFIGCTPPTHTLFQLCFVIVMCKGSALQLTGNIAVVVDTQISPSQHHCKACPDLCLPLWMVRKNMRPRSLL